MSGFVEIGTPKKWKRFICFIIGHWWSVNHLKFKENSHFCIRCGFSK